MIKYFIKLYILLNIFYILLLFTYNLFRFCLYDRNYVSNQPNRNYHFILYVEYFFHICSMR